MNNFAQLMNSYNKALVSMANDQERNLNILIDALNDLATVTKQMAEDMEARVENINAMLNHELEDVREMEDETKNHLLDNGD